MKGVMPLPCEWEGGRMAEYKDFIIVTGSTGFVGSALINKLTGRFSLVGFDRAVTG